MTDRLRSILDEIIARNRAALHQKIGARREEMAGNNVEHYRLYELLGFSEEEGQKIDLYQNIGRFVYKYAGALLEEATVAVLQHTQEGRRIRIPNTVSPSPKNFEIDFFVNRDNKAHEIKWRDATTDGDHVRKEHNKIRCIVGAGMIPVRIMYYMPNREQAIRIQERIIATYREHGEAYIGGAAWDYIRNYTGFDLYAYLYRRTRDEEL
jgi:type II restriction enzyme